VYSSAANRAYLRRREIKMVIPVKEDHMKHRRARGRASGRPAAFDAGHYERRNTVELCSAGLKQFRRRDPGRQARVQVPGHRRRRVDPDLAASSVP
jgi:hypothetical protein